MVNQDITTSLTKNARFWWPTLCQGVNCKNEFTPKRKDQRFCSPECRKKFFRLARKLGANVLHSLKSEIE